MNDVYQSRIVRARRALRPRRTGNRNQSRREERGGNESAGGACRRSRAGSVIRAVVDANVLISSVIAPLGPSRRIFDAWRDGTFVLVTSAGLLEEVSRRLAHPRIAKRYSITSEDRIAVLGLLEAYATIARGRREVAVTRDPTDDKVIAAAIEAGAQYIVTGDKDLLTVGEYEGVAIVSPARFLISLGEEQQSP